MELKRFLLFISTFYLISCANSVPIYNDELSKNDHVSRVLPRLPRSPSIWNLGDTKEPSRQKKNLLEEQEGMRHENVIYITLTGNSERSKESSEDKHKPLSLWSILGKTTELLTPSFIRGLLPTNLIDNFIINSRSKFDPPPFFPDGLESRSKFDPPPYNPEDVGSRSKFDPPPFFPDDLGSRSKFDPPPFFPDDLGSRSKFDPSPYNPDDLGSRWGSQLGREFIPI